MTQAAQEGEPPARHGLGWEEDACSKWCSGQAACLWGAARLELPGWLLDLDNIHPRFASHDRQALGPVTLADLLLAYEASPAPGWRLLVRYVDTLCQMHGTPPVAYGLQYADGRPLLDVSAGTVVAGGGKSIMIELPGCDNTFKVSCPAPVILGR